jgi:hypothetical protein
MTRRTTPRHVIAERTFPVRVRVPVPPGGFGRDVNLMHEWLRDRAPGAGHFVCGDRGPPDAALVYFRDIEIAHAFCDAFAYVRVARTLEGSRDMGHNPVHDDPKTAS